MYLKYENVRKKNLKNIRCLSDFIFENNCKLTFSKKGNINDNKKVRIFSDLFYFTWL